MNRYVHLEIPFEKVNQFARLYEYGYFTPFTITHRANIAYKKELEIVKVYNRELRNIVSYYSLACNQYQLKKLFYLAESSFIKTIAYKRRTTSKKAIKSMRKHKQGYLTIIHKHKPGHFISESFIKWKERHD